MKKLLYVLFALLLLNSCGDDEEVFQPQVTSLKVSEQVPTSLNANAPDVYTELLSMQSNMNVSGAIMDALPEDYEAGTDYNYNGYVINYSYSQQSNQWVYTYTISLNGVWYYEISGWENTDGTAGAWDYTLNPAVFGFDGANFQIHFDWTMNAAGDYHMEMLFDYGSYGQISYVYNINHDLSGDLTYTMDGDLWFEAEWDSTGHGSYIDHFYDPNTTFTF
ncbi:MAG: hypothetical protein K9I34_05180 [Bacteroidales bacterium]|nr:hypothetical protein [Bacteroidales bacterium]